MHDPAGQSSSRVSAATVELSVRNGLRIVHVAGEEECQSALAGLIPVGVPETLRATGDDRLRAIWIAPSRWFFVADGNGNVLDVLHTVPADIAAVVDYSDARACFRVRGRDARLLLAKGCALDFHPTAFAVNHVAQTVLGHFRVLLDCRAVDMFDVYVASSYARSLQEWLADAGAEFAA